MSQSDISDNLHAAVFRAQIDQLYLQLPRVLAYSLLVALVMSFMFANVLPASRIATWMVTMLIVLLVRTVLYFHYRHNQRNHPDVYWARRFVLLAGLSGIVWGMAGVALFVPERLELQALILLVLAGMGAGSAAVLPMYLPAFYAYFPVSMAPAGVMLVSQGESFHVMMGIFDAIFVLGLLTFGRAVGDAFRSSLEFRFENIELVKILQVQTQELERANLAKSKFLAAASHDLRQPMHALTLFAEVLDREASDEKISALADSIRTSVNALVRLFDSLLDISRLDAGVLIPEISIFRVQDVIDRVIIDCRPQADEKGLELSHGECPCFTETDPVLLERILRNLVSNAIRYTTVGRVCINCHDSEDMLKISVSDTGAGIPAGEQENIFQEFTQLGNPERDRSKGLGLGLSIVRRLARLLNHPLELNSKPDEGTTFVLQLPLRVALNRDRVMEPVVSPVNPGSCVLVVDDDTEVRAGMSALLVSWGYRVITTASADEAEAVLKSGQSQPDAMIVDFRLPENRSGTQFIRHLHETIDIAIPALLISGDTEPSRLQEAKYLGLELLHKPVAPARLRAWLNNATQR